LLDVSTIKLMRLMEVVSIYVTEEDGIVRLVEISLLVVGERV